MSITCTSTKTKIFHLIDRLEIRFSTTCFMQSEVLKSSLLIVSGMFLNFSFIPNCFHMFYGLYKFVCLAVRPSVKPNVDDSLIHSQNQ